MKDRLLLQKELETFLPKVYFQPPTNLQMSYPCIVYGKSGKSNIFSNNKKYHRTQTYQITVIDVDPDSTIADNIEEHFQYCSINQQYVVDNLHHTTLTLYY